MSLKKENNYIHTVNGTEIISHNLAKKYGLLEEILIDDVWYNTYHYVGKYHTFRRAEQAKKNKELHNKNSKSIYEYTYTVVKLVYDLNRYLVNYKNLEN